MPKSADCAANASQNARPEELEKSISAPENSGRQSDNTSLKKESDMLKDSAKAVFTRRNIKSAKPRQSPISRCRKSPSCRCRNISAPRRRPASKRRRGAGRPGDRHGRRIRLVEHSRSGIGYGSGRRCNSGYGRHSPSLDLDPRRRRCLDRHDRPQRPPGKNVRSF